jgi:hypothetical protein
MSLIEEALKKQQEEFGNSASPHIASPQGDKIPPTLKKTEAPPTAPSLTPPPLPVAPAKSSSKTLLPVIILISVCVVLLVVTFWLISAGFLKMFMAPKVPSKAPVIATAPAKTPEQQPPTPIGVAIPAPAVMGTPPAALSIPKALPLAPEPPPPLVGSPATSTVVPSQPPVPQKAVVVLDEEGQPPTGRTVTPLPSKKITVWPEMTITGIIGADLANGAALINGQLISVGESYQGVKILSISRNSIKAVYDGETRTLKVGGK